MNNSIKVITILSMTVVPVLLYLIMYYLLEFEQKKSVFIAVGTAVILIIFGVRDLVRSRS